MNLMGAIFFLPLYVVLNFVTPESRSKATDYYNKILYDYNILL